MKSLRVFIGYDSREPVAYHVAAHTVLTTASGPVAIMPLVQSQLRTAGLYTRERGNTEATEFSMTRFLVPYLSGYEGVSVFMDCDVVVRGDVVGLVRDLMAQPASSTAVWVAQHDYVPKASVKMDGQTQTTYPRKNWSSVMVFANVRCHMLTPTYVNEASGLELHRFLWLQDPQIGSLPLEWNWLVEEYPHHDRAKILHYTNGGPWFAEHQDCDHASDWLDAYDALRSPTPDRWREVAQNMMTAMAAADREPLDAIRRRRAVAQADGVP